MLKSDKDKDKEDDGLGEQKDTSKEVQVIKYTPKQIYNYSENGSIDELRLALDSLDDGETVFWYKSQDGNGSTALLVAAWKGHTACVRVLLDIGADIESKNNQGGTALHLSSLEGHTACIGVLLDRGAAIETKSIGGETALHAAAQQGHTECIGVLLDRGADVESKTRRGLKALHLAAEKGIISCICVLLGRGADVESKDNLGNTALHTAAHYGHISCINLLLDRGADVESQQNQGYTALMIAARRGRIACTRLLLDRQAMINKDETSRIQHPETKQMILDEILYRLRRAAFDSFVNHHIDYPPLIHNIYSTCYPSGDLRVAAPAIGWDRAEAVRNKYYFDEVLFYVHVYVALVHTRSAKKQSAGTEVATSLCMEQLASSSNKTSTLMTVLSSYLKEYLIPDKRLK